MNVLVTGGAGFLGSHITNLLIKEGNDVTILDNLTKGHKDAVNPHAKLIVGDIEDPTKTKEALKGIDAVIHMAGLIVVPESVEKPDLYAKTNVLGSINLFDCMQQEGVNKVIFSSSACVYGMPKNLPITENEPLHPDNPYGASKASIEAFLQAYHANFNFDVTILRYFNPYGPGELHDPETHAIPNFIKATL
ncbi:UDP-glucose 4-epimerase, partial [Candidatus Curtissbacteria bacterium]|nr:UDP-glucose 4-epimerase [Candidatus Curtissbacteria bacterium]